MWNAQAQQIKTVTPQWIDEISASKSDTLYIVNFWATWCKPCVEELPYFEQLADSCANKKVKIFLNQLVKNICEKNLFVTRYKIF